MLRPISAVALRLEAPAQAVGVIVPAAELQESTLIGVWLLVPLVHSGPAEGQRATPAAAKARLLSHYPWTQTP